MTNASRLGALIFWYAEARCDWEDELEQAEARALADAKADGYRVISGGQDSPWGRVASYEENEPVLRAYEAKIGQPLMHIDHVHETAYEQAMEYDPSVPDGLPDFLARAIGETDKTDLRAWLSVATQGDSESPPKPTTGG
jgi:hypothetical protein